MKERIDVVDHPNGSGARGRDLRGSRGARLSGAEGPRGTRRSRTAAEAAPPGLATPADPVGGEASLGILAGVVLLVVGMATTSVGVVQGGFLLPGIVLVGAGIALLGIVSLVRVLQGDNRTEARTS